jgi:recombinase-like protein
LLLDAPLARACAGILYMECGLIGKPNTPWHYRGQRSLDVSDDHNPLLAPTSGSSRKGGEATLEDPNRVENLRWQTRPAPLTDLENALAEALQTIFADEVYGLDGIVERLNRMKVAPPAGASAWSEECFRAEMRRLADLTGGS